MPKVEMHQRERLSWRERLVKRFHQPEEAHRICRKCRERILRNHKWRVVRIFWFVPWYCCEHKDCDHPTMEPPRQVAERLEMELPFEEIIIDPDARDVLHA